MLKKRLVEEKWIQQIEKEEEKEENIDMDSNTTKTGMESW